MMCLFLGVLGVETGLLHKNEMDGTKSQGFVFFMMMAMIMGGYAALTPQMLGSMILPLLAALVCDILSIMLIGALLGPKLGISRPLSMALGMNVMVGFPMNLMISEDVIRFLVRDQEEQERMLSAVGTKMVLGGFVSTTFLSTVAAGFLVGFMQQLVRLGFFAAKRAGGRCSGTAADRGFAKFRRQGAPDLVHSFRHFIERDRKANAGQR